MCVIRHGTSDLTCGWTAKAAYAHRNREQREGESSHKYFMMEIYGHGSQQLEMDCDMYEF